jgi:hypothetical protein
MYWIPKEMTESLDNYPWQTPELLENYPELFDRDSQQHGPYYLNRLTRQQKTVESNTTWAMDMPTLENIMPWPDLGTQGWNDPFFAGIRQRLGIHNFTVKEPICYHAWHTTTWDKDTNKAVRLASQELNRWNQNS